VRRNQEPDCRLEVGVEFGDRQCFSRQQLCHTEGLYQVIIGSGIESGYFIFHDLLLSASEWEADCSERGAACTTLYQKVRATSNRQLPVYIEPTVYSGTPSFIAILNPIHNVFDLRLAEYCSLSLVHPQPEEFSLSFTLFPLPSLLQLLGCLNLSRTEWNVSSHTGTSAREWQQPGMTNRSGVLIPLNQFSRLCQETLVE